MNNHSRMDRMLETRKARERASYGLDADPDAKVSVHPPAT